MHLLFLIINFQGQLYQGIEPSIAIITLVKYYFCHVYHKGLSDCKDKWSLTGTQNARKLALSIS